MVGAQNLHGSEGKKHVWVPFLWDAHVNSSRNAVQAHDLAEESWAVLRRMLHLFKLPPINHYRLALGDVRLQTHGVLILAEV